MNRIKAKSLVLEDGSTYGGFQFGGSEFAYGEVVFNTSMTGYQEILTDPSYAGQIVSLLTPLLEIMGSTTKTLNQIKYRFLVLLSENIVISRAIMIVTMT